MQNRDDGGYYAIKGFLYQFDKSIIEILSNPTSVVRIETKQDIDYQDFVIQVKHKETQRYQDHKIKHAVIQLLELFKNDKSEKFCLYCHFANKTPHRWDISTTDLDRILGDKQNDYSLYLKADFIKNFYIQFSENFEAQFLSLIALIEETFSLTDRDEAFLYHSLFRSKLLEIAISEKDKRKISRAELENFINDAEKNIFYGAYSKYLDRGKYEKMVKKEFFTFQKANIDNFERLFIIDCDNKVGLIDLNKMVNSLSNKYFKKGKSPQPFIFFMNLEHQKLVDFKIDLIDQGIIFNDGTYFDGDKFRLDKIKEKELSNEKIRIKIIGAEHIHKLINRLKIHEVFQFYLKSPFELETPYNHIKIQIVETEQILKMI